MPQDLQLHTMRHQIGAETSPFTYIDFYTPVNQIGYFIWVPLNWIVEEGSFEAKSNLQTHTQTDTPAQIPLQEGS